MSSSNRLLAIHIMEILNEHADSKNTMSQVELMQRLENEYGNSISRHTCSDYLKELKDEGYIEGSKGIYKKNLFSDRELRTLIDGVMYGKHIPEKDATTLIEKLKKLSINSMRSKVKRLTYLSAINRTKNDNLYETLDIIDDAIEKELKIEITQYSPQIDGTRKEWAAKVVDPYFVVSDQSRYYLLCNTNRDNKFLLEPRRVDRISKIKLLDKPVTPKEKVLGNNFDLGKYMKEHVYMFSGNAGRAELKISNKDIGSFEDWHGTNYNVIRSDDKNSIISIITNYNALYYWLLQYGDVAEVVEPAELRTRIKDGLTKMIEKYNR